MYRIYFIPRERIEEWERGENIPYKSKVRRPRDNVGVTASIKGWTRRSSHEVSDGTIDPCIVCLDAPVDDLPVRFCVVGGF
ncbi:hypothetical protein CDAR_368931 [Caerostris darwini]|uniref:Uncharacterized protein n=1 Tax=Caerostris darwini TaxID=1538125 RepID=A0AAV4NHD0_9ARAC|nr:hypothetical protein CDAR_368931 [Caerostris darwini]